MSKKIEVRNVSKRFSDKLVLDNVSFEIEKGEIFGLIGPNGAGKSTLINVMIGLLEAEHGEICIDGKTMAQEAIEYKRKIGLVPQELALLEELNAWDNLEYFATFYGLSGKKMKETMEEVLQMAGLYEKRKQKVKKYSGGMKRRLNVAIAMMHHPEVLILDEPTVGVDPQSRNHIFDFIRKVNQEERTTVIYTSHYMEEVEALCSRIFIMDEGKKVAYGNNEDIRHLTDSMKTIHLKVNRADRAFLNEMLVISEVRDVNQISAQDIELVTSDKFNLDEVIRLCQQHELKIKSINIEEPTLEEVFLTLTGKRLRD